MPLTKLKLTTINIERIHVQSTLVIFVNSLIESLRSYCLQNFLFGETTGFHSLYTVSNSVLNCLSCIFFYQTLHYVGGPDRFREERVLEDSPGIYDKNEERRRIRLQYCQGNFLSFVIPFAIQSMLFGLLRPCKRRKLYFAFFVCVFL